MELLLAFQKKWTAANYANSGQTVLLAVSGGMDSMVMATIFLKSNMPFAVAHCNFNLRGGEADKDEQLVLDWCKANDIECHNTRFDTKEKTIEWKKGVQETARILRYEWLEMVRAANNFAAIATAHHANDNAETLLINLFKGTGISGLHGIPVQNGKIIRPLLFATKEAIEHYAAANDVPYRDDASNATDAYLRNAVRHHIIPAAAKWFPDAVQQVSSSIERFAQVEILYNKAIAAERKKLLEQRGPDFYIPILKLQKAVPLETICYELFEPFGFTAAQVPHILQLLSSESGHYISSSGHRVIRNRDFLVITGLQTTATDIISVDAAPAIANLGAHSISFSIGNRPVVIPSGTDIACIDMRLVSFPLILRKWRIGDYFYPLGMNMKKKKVSRFLIDQKVALHDKEHVWVVECQKRIAWVAGMRMDERFKIKDSTTSVLIIERKAANLQGAATDR